jgi:tetratricopeptide (TPR) repeat protein
MSDEKDDSEFQKLIDKIQIELDPEKIEQSFSGLQDRVRRITSDGMYTKVRIKFRGKTIVPEMPLGVFLAAEVATFWYAGLLRALAVNLGMKSLIEVEFIHRSTEKVAEGREAYEEGEVDLAEKLYREALDMRPDDPIACYHLGVLLRVTARRDEALRCFETAAIYESEVQEKAKKALEKMKRGPRTL